MGDLSEHFSSKEFFCRCGDCDPLEMPKPNGELVAALQWIRTAYGEPIIITSGVRCPAGNVEAGGVDDSAHLTGHAADVQVANSRERFRLVELALKANVNRIGVGRDFLHLDVDKSKQGQVMWLYGNR
jgi:uncharacterized protein YcbK (DUF882 family)